VRGQPHNQTIAGSRLRRSQDSRHDEIVRLEERLEERALNVSSRHLADMLAAAPNVRFWGNCVPALWGPSSHQPGQDQEQAFCDDYHGANETLADATQPRFRAGAHALPARWRCRGLAIKARLRETEVILRGSAAP
jgi:hypothetical protein